MSRRDVKTQWELRRADQLYLARLDETLLRDLFAPPIWHAMATLIADGPGVASAFMDRLMHRAAAEPSAATGRKRCERTLKTIAWPLRWTMKTLVELNQHGVPSVLLEPWVAAPSVRIPAAPQAHTDTSAPPLRSLRLAAQQLDQRVWEALGARNVTEELQIIRTCGITRLRRGVWLNLRYRAQFLLLLTLGARIGAVKDLRRSDLIAEHTGPDDACGPAVELRPGKRYHLDEVHIKPIPPGLYARLESLNVATDRLLTEVRDYSEPSGTRPASSADLPLFPSSLKNAGISLSAQAFNAWLQGDPHRPGARTRDPVVQRGDGTSYSAHRLRGALMQALTIAARRYCEQDERVMTPEAIVQALVDHAIPDDTYGYLDMNDLRGRERLSGIGTALAWSMLMGHAGARTVRNHARYRDELQRLSVVEAEERRLNATITQALGSHAGREKRAAQILFEVKALEEQRREFQNEKLEIEHQIDRLRNDPSTRVAVPDDATDGEARDRFDEIDAELAAARPAHRDSSAAPRCREWTTPRETAELFGISYPQLARWANGEHLPHPHDQARNPWPADGVPIDTSLGPKRRRISIGHVNPAYYSTLEQQHLLIELLGVYPKGWTRADCEAPLELPPGVGRSHALPA